MILDKIVIHKKREVAENKKRTPINTLYSRCGQNTIPFAANLRKPGQVALIAEIKKASPSKGLIRENFDPVAIAQIYLSTGASAISVLTDCEFFQGSPDYLKRVRETVELPLLRKDFVVDPYQIYEAKALGADAVLLIMSILTDQEAGEYRKIASELGLECLVEVHSAEEMERALGLEAPLIGINNRNLQTFKTDIETTFRLREMVKDPAITIVSESGINTPEDVLQLKQHETHAMLVGEALMREEDIGRKVRELLC